MLTYQKEIDCGFDDFLTYMMDIYEGRFIFVYGKERIEAEIDTIFEDETPYEDDDPRFEEFNTILFEKDDGTCLLVNYHNLPDEIFHDGVLIYKKENGILVRVK